METPHHKLLKKTHEQLCFRDVDWAWETSNAMPLCIWGWFRCIWGRNASPLKKNMGCNSSRRHQKKSTQMKYPQRSSDEPPYQTDACACGSMSIEVTTKFDLVKTSAADRTFFCILSLTVEYRRWCLQAVQNNLQPCNKHIKIFV